MNYVVYTYKRRSLELGLFEHFLELYVKTENNILSPVRMLRKLPKINNISPKFDTLTSTKILLGFFFSSWRQQHPMVLLKIIITI